MTAAAKAKNAAIHAESLKVYKKQVVKTLQYLEKSQACDPDERTLSIINNLYSSIKEPQNASVLQSRLAPLSKDCISLLEDE